MKRFDGLVIWKGWMLVIRYKFIKRMWIEMQIRSPSTYVLTYLNEIKDVLEKGQVKSITN